MENQVEIITENPLVKMVEESGLEKTKAQILLDNFKNYFEVAAKWEAQAKTIKVISENQESDMKIARVGRLELRDMRITLEKKRKELKEQSLREGKAIDGIANALKAVIIPIEEYLEQQEKFVEIQENKKREAMRIEIEKKLEEERIAKEKAEEEERLRIKLENEKLKKEAEQREKLLFEERAKAEAERKKQDETLRLEREKAELEKRKQEEELRKQKEESDRIQREIEAKSRAEQDRIKKEAEAKAEDQRKEKERLEELLKNQIECPHCHKTFQLERKN